MKKKILIVASFADSLTRFRGDMIKDFVQHGYAVLAAAPEIAQVQKNELQNLGATPVEYSLQRKGLNPFKDAKTIFSLKQLIKKHGVNLVMPYTIKPVIYSSIAANWSGVPVISLITGLGFTFSGASRKAKLLERVTSLLYRISIRSNKIVVFQNKDDHTLFVKKGILTKKHPIKIVSGSGVNLKNFTVKSYPSGHKKEDKVIFVFVGRLIEEKGIGLFVNAAKSIKRKYPNAEFHILGAPDGSKSSISLKELNSLDQEGIIKYHGSQKSVVEYLRSSDVFVLPTFYREGIPRSILEALSVGLPIITTDSPGCRETVLPNNENGILIKKNNQKELIEAITFFLENTSEIESMGKASRSYAEKRFNVSLINKEIIQAVQAIL